MKKTTYLAVMMAMLMMGCDAKQSANASNSKSDEKVEASKELAPVNEEAKTAPVESTAPAVDTVGKVAEEAAKAQPEVLSVEQVDKSIRDAVAKSLRGAQVESVLETPVPGIYQVQLNSGEVTHFTQDAKYMFVGDLYQIDDRSVVNLTEQGRSVERVKLLASLDDKDLVVFPSSGLEKGQVYVFTDVSCGYCMKFHSEVPDLNAKGITVKYAAWPRAGAKSEPGRIMKDVWCSPDRRSAMNKAKSRQPVEPSKDSCTDQVILDQIAMGYKMGVRGTPAVFDKTGRQLGGYVPADQLVHVLTQQ